ncbi:unnamed protein product [Rotaria socialis]|nr:unnamed protein product [Rotaria socialis]
MLTNSAHPLDAKWHNNANNGIGNHAKHNCCSRDAPITITTNSIPSQEFELVGIGWNWNWNWNWLEVVRIGIGIGIGRNWVSIVRNWLELELLWNWFRIGSELI